MGEGVPNADKAGNIEKLCFLSCFRVNEVVGLVWMWSFKIIMRKERNYYANHSFFRLEEEV